MTLRELQTQQKEWADKNFGEFRPSHWPLLGALEELGELAHSHLKAEQGIRGTLEEHRAKAGDAVADTIIYLCDYCNLNGLSIQEELEKAWAVVSERNWVVNPTTGQST